MDFSTPRGYNKTNLEKERLAMTKFQKILIALLGLNLVCTVGLYLRLDSQQLLLEKEGRSMIVGTRYDDTNLKNSLASLEKQVGRLDASTRKANEQKETPAQEAPAQQPMPAPQPRHSSLGSLLDRLFH